MKVVRMMMRLCIAHYAYCIVTREGAYLNCESFLFDEDMFEVACFESYNNC